MITCIRFCFVSFVFIGCLFSEGNLVQVPSGVEVEYQSFSEIDSTWECQNSRIPFRIKQQLKGKLSLEKEGRFTFPLSFQMIITNLDYKINHKKYSLESPGQITELIELERLKLKPLTFSITDNYPYLNFSPTFNERYKGLKFVSSQSLTGYFGEDLHKLIQIVNLPLKIDEPLELIKEKSTIYPFQRKQMVTLKEVNDDEIVVEVATSIEREKVFFDGTDFAVIYGEIKEMWTINRLNALDFQMEEKGTFSTALKVNNSDTKQDHQIFRKILSK